MSFPTPPPPLIHSASPAVSYPAAKSGFNYKEFILAALTVAGNGITFFLWKQAVPRIIAGDFSGYTEFIYPLVCLVISGVLFSLAALFIRNRWIIYPAALIGIGAPYLLLPAANSVLGALGISFVLILFAVRKIRKEFIFSLGFSTAKTLHVGLPLYFTSAAIIVSLFYVQLVDQNNAVTILVPKPALDFTLSHFLNSQYVKSLTGISDIRSDSRVDDMIDALLQEQAKKEGVPISKVPREEREKVRKSQRDEFAKQYRISLTGEERVGDVMYILVAQRIEELLGPYKKYLPIVAAVAFFFAFKAFTFPLYLISLFSTFLLIKLLIFVKVITTVVHQIEVEKLSL